MRRGEVVKPGFLRVLLVLVETTSIPLLVLCLVYLLTGYQMQTSSLRFFPRAREIHTDPTLRVLLVIMAFIHGYSGLILLCERRIRNKILKLAVEYSITGLLIVLAVFIIFLEYILLR